MQFSQRSGIVRFDLSSVVSDILQTLLKHVTVLTIHPPLELFNRRNTSKCFQKKNVVQVIFVSRSVRVFIFFFSLFCVMFVPGTYNYTNVSIYVPACTFTKYAQVMSINVQFMQFAYFNNIYLGWVYIFQRLIVSQTPLFGYITTCLLVSPS